MPHPEPHRTYATDTTYATDPSDRPHPSHSSHSSHPMQGVTPCLCAILLLALRYWFKKTSETNTETRNKLGDPCDMQQGTLCSSKWAIPAHHRQMFSNKVAAKHRAYAIMSSVRDKGNLGGRLREGAGDIADCGLQIADLTAKNAARPAATEGTAPRIRAISRIKRIFQRKVAKTQSRKEGIPIPIRERLRALAPLRYHNSLFKIRHCP